MKEQNDLTLKKYMVKVEQLMEHAMVQSKPSCLKNLNLSTLHIFLNSKVQKTFDIFEK